MAKAEPMELIYSLIGFPRETEWLEFKVGNTDPQQIGCDISALANAAAWLGREAGYKIWGVDDITHELTGTNFDYLAKKARGNQDLLIWLKQVLTANANYDFDQFDHDGKHYVVLAVRAAYNQPVCFQGRAYIRTGSTTTDIAPGSAREAELWRRLQRTDFENRICLEDVQISEIGDILATEAFFDLLGIRKTEGLGATFGPLEEQDLIRRQDNGRVSITNLGALLIGRDMTSLPGLAKRPVRILQFAGKSNREILDDRTFVEGYALSLQAAEDYIMAHVPAREVADGAFRRVRYAFPQRAVRELLANLVIHQDMSIASQGPLVSIYENRIEFNNPGASLIQPMRVLNALPKTRNNALAGLMRQMDLCEEGGTGWDIAVAACENVHTLPPKMVSDEELGTRVTLFADVAFDRMSKRERLDALYWHCCLCYADGESMSNQTLRARFGLTDDAKHSLAMSRLIRDGCTEGLIKVEDEEVGTKLRRYIPCWA